MRQALEPLPEESLRGLLVPPALHQDVEDIPLLVNSSPEVMAMAIHREKHFIQMPRVAWLRAPVPQLIWRTVAQTSHTTCGWPRKSR
jgi:hypothetical protein